MSKIATRFLILLTLICVPHTVLAALPGPHNPTANVQGFRCVTCHNSTSSLGATSYDNTCISCHKIGGSSPSPTIFVQPVNTFAFRDFANPFKTYTGTVIGTGKFTQSSHKWTGSDVVPQAGAKAPVDRNNTTAKSMNKSNLQGSVTCIRCHNVHGDSGPSSTVTPFMRSANDKDQMCMDCHSVRSVKSHTLGSHPVNVSYTSARAKAMKADNTLLATPVVNATAQLVLNNNSIVCSTCHGVHYTDSNSRTADNRLNASLGNLSTSTGHLLRVDAFGKTADDINVCTNCHVKKSHNGTTKNQNIQCVHCHSGHVEYDAADPTAAQGINTFLVRRYINYTAATGAVRNKRVFFTFTGAARNYNGAQGVCNACHTVPTGGSYPPEHANTTDARVCNDCHNHSGTTTSFSGGCSSCHGYPPSINTPAGPSGYAVSGAKNYSLAASFKNESLTPHASHSGGSAGYTYKCDECHQGNSHDDGTFQQVFINKAGLIASTIIGSNPTYNITSPGTCTTSYCHSDGNGGNYKTVTWAGQKGTIAVLGGCTACHLGSAIPSGSHPSHVTSGIRNYSCGTCHSLTVSTGSDVIVTNKANHVNGIKDIQFSGTAPATGTFTDLANTCAVTCHNNGKGTGPVTVPVWGTASTGACGACHATKSAGSNLATNGHAAHLTAAVTAIDNTSCISCHTGYTANNAASHVNGTLETPTGCSINTCHGTITPPTWTVSLAGKNSCTKCHGTPTTGVVASADKYLFAPMTSIATATDAGKVSANAKKGAHETHLRFLNGFSNYSTVEYRCEACHGTSVTTFGIKHSDGVSSPQGRFQNLATKWGKITPTYAGTNCSNTYCHNPAGTTPATVADSGLSTAPSWTSASYIDNTGKSLANCQKCHLVPGSGGFSKQSAHSGAYAVTDSSANQCNACHGHNGDDTGIIGKRHIDGILYASGDCDSCHGYPPMTAGDLAARSGGWVHAKLEDPTSLGGGYHKLHTLSTIVKGDAFTPCLPCHPNDSLGVHKNVSSTVVAANVDVFYAADTSFRLDGSRAKRYNRTATVTNRTCSNVSCHFRPTQPWR